MSYVAWAGTVGASEHLGSDTFIHIHGIPGCNPMTVRDGGKVSFKNGETVHLIPYTNQIHKFDRNGLRFL